VCHFRRAVAIGWLQWAVGHRLPIAGSRLPGADCREPIAGSRTGPDMEVRFPSQPIAPLGHLPWVAAALLLSWGSALGQDLPRSTGDCWREPLLPGCLDALRLRCNATSENSPPITRDNVRLFRMTTGYLADPVGVVDTDPPAAFDQASLPGSDADGLGRVQVTAGNDNPYLDFRRPGDPGG